MRAVGTLLLATVVLLVVVSTVVFGSSDDVLFSEYGSSKCPHCVPLHEFLQEHFPNHHVFCDIASDKECAEHFVAWLQATGMPPYVPQTIVLKNRWVIAVVIGEVRNVTFWETIASAPVNTTYIPVYDGERFAGYLKTSSPSAHQYIINNLLYFPNQTATTITNTTPTTTTPPQTPANTMTATNSLPQEKAQSLEKPLPYLLVTLALTDSINPCAITIYALLLANVMLFRGRKRAVASGVCFITGIIAGYTLVGIGLLYGASQISIPTSVLRAILGAYGGLVVFRGLTVKDATCPSGVCREADGTLSRITKIEERIAGNELSHFLLGLVLSLTLLPCSAGPYLVFILVLSKVHEPTAIPYILLYNLVFITPLLAVMIALLGVEKKLDVEKIRKPAYIVAGTLLILFSMLFA